MTRWRHVVASTGISDELQLPVMYDLKHTLFRVPRIGPEENA